MAIRIDAFALLSSETTDAQAAGLLHRFREFLNGESALLNQWGAEPVDVDEDGIDS